MDLAVFEVDEPVSKAEFLTDADNVNDQSPGYTKMVPNAAGHLISNVLGHNSRCLLSNSLVSLMMESINQTVNSPGPQFV
jgi:hypothetical protein